MIIDCFLNNLIDFQLTIFILITLDYQIYSFILQIIVYIFLNLFIHLKIIVKIIFNQYSSNFIFIIIINFINFIYLINLTLIISHYLLIIIDLITHKLIIKIQNFFNLQFINYILNLLN